MVLSKETRYLLFNRARNLFGDSSSVQCIVQSEMEIKESDLDRVVILACAEIGKRKAAYEEFVTATNNWLDLLHKEVRGGL